MTEPEPRGEDPKLDALLGEEAAARFRTVFDGYPDGVGLLWAVRDGAGRIWIEPAERGGSAFRFTLPPAP